VRLFTAGKYEIAIVNDTRFSIHSSDSLTEYDVAYLTKLPYGYPPAFGIGVYDKESLVRSAVVGGEGGNPLDDNALVLEKDRMIFCCGDEILCLSLPDLSLTWRTKADTVSCLEVFQFHNTYIVCGACDISRLNIDGTILWQQRGGDLFETPERMDEFAINQHYIVAKDCLGKEYRFDFNGTLILD
jgi:hypothetical protein